MECIQVYLDAQYVGTMACPQCRTRRVVNVPQQCPQVLPVAGKRSVTVTCRCGAIFATYFDLRRHLRKAVQLRGTLGAPQTGAPLSDIVISSLSVHGLGFTLATALGLRIGERYTTSFRLDDAEQSLIQEFIIIRRLQELTAGATFYPDEQYNYALDFMCMGARSLLPPPHLRRLDARGAGGPRCPSTSQCKHAQVHIIVPFLSLQSLHFPGCGGLVYRIAGGTSPAVGAVVRSVMTLSRIAPGSVCRTGQGET